LVYESVRVDGGRPSTFPGVRPTRYSMGSGWARSKFQHPKEGYLFVQSGPVPARPSVGRRLTYDAWDVLASVFLGSFGSSSVVLTCLDRVAGSNKLYKRQTNPKPRPVVIIELASDLNAPKGSATILRVFHNLNPLFDYHRARTLQQVTTWHPVLAALGLKTEDRRPKGNCWNY